MGGPSIWSGGLDPATSCERRRRSWSPSGDREHPMPNYAPPPNYDGSPRPYELPAGSRLSRVFTTRLGPREFNPTLAPLARVGGGRFDATSEDEYAYLYAAL